MLPTNRCARSGDTLIPDRQHLHILSAVERVADANAPGMAVVRTRHLDITTGINIKIDKSHLFEQLRRLENGPTLNDTGRVDEAIMLDVEVALRFLPGLLAQGQNRFHSIADRKSVV